MQISSNHSISGAISYPFIPQTSSEDGGNGSEKPNWIHDLLQQERHYHNRSTSKKFPCCGMNISTMSEITAKPTLQSLNMWIHWWFLNIPKGHCHWPWAHGALVCSSFLLAQWSSHLQSLFGSEWFCSLHGCFCLQASSLQLCSTELTVSSSTVYFFSFYLLINPLVI